ncbi:unnamed protein product [Acanthosepion pharaonis]|uniref:Uncharacterized protein n=1 Tax=Acanthosepion pharaonis TaxID=158019 RepID=A0A812DK55_ACAPH|nr:unnamed protein product [Sepia pharaonis]
MSFCCVPVNPQTYGHALPLSAFSTRNNIPKNGQRADLPEPSLRARHNDCQCACSLFLHSFQTVLQFRPLFPTLPPFSYFSSFSFTFRPPLFVRFHFFFFIYICFLHSPSLTSASLLLLSFPILFFVLLDYHYHHYDFLLLLLLLLFLLLLLIFLILTQHLSYFFLYFFFTFFILFFFLLLLLLIVLKLLFLFLHISHTYRFIS